jgi:hypothetical protein
LDSIKRRISNLKPYGDGNASYKIIDVAMEWLTSARVHPLSDQLNLGPPALRLVKSKGEIPPFAGLVFDLQGTPLIPSDIEGGLEIFSVIHAPESALRGRIGCDGDSRLLTSGGGNRR